jgi:hypothetical protein
MKFKFHLLLFVLLGTLNLIAFILYPEGINSKQYLLSVSWVNILIFLNWYIFVYFFGHKNDSGAMGILPGSALVLLCGSIISIILLFFFTLGGVFFSKIHFIIQIVAVSSTVIMMLLLGIIGNIGDNGLKKDQASKVQIVQLLNSWIKENTNSDIDSDLLYLRDLVNYDLPHDRIVQENNLWLNLSREIISSSNLNERNDDILKAWIVQAKEVKNALS